MKDNLSIVITIIVLVLLMVIFPLYNFFERQDDMSYNLVLKATTAFTDEVLKNGYIDQAMYDKFVNQIANTGNLYDIQLEAHRRVLTKDPLVPEKDIYTEQSIIDYNKDIFKDINSNNPNIVSGNLMDKFLKDNIYYLNPKDEFYVKVKNSSTTMAGALFNVIIPTSKKERIVVNYGGIVKNNAWKKIDATYIGHQQAPGMPKIYIGSGNLKTEIKDGDVIAYTPEKPITASSVVFSTEAFSNEVKNFVWVLQDITDPNNPIIKTPNGSKGVTLEPNGELNWGLLEKGKDYELIVYSLDKYMYKSDDKVLKFSVEKDRFGVNVSSDVDIAAINKGSGQYDANSSVRVYTSPSDATKYKFEGWYVNNILVSTNQEYIFTITENISLVAKYSKIYNENAYVDDGLKISLDGGKNTSTIHSSSATVWKNLISPGTSFNIIGNSNWQNNSFTFDGNQYLDLGIQNHDEVTFEVVMKFNELTPNQTILGNHHKGGYALVYSGDNFDNGKSGYLGFEVYDASNPDKEYPAVYSDIKLEKDKVYSISCGFSKSNRMMYISVNGSVVSMVYNGSFNQPIDNTIMTVGIDTFNEGIIEKNLRATVYSLRIYNKKLDGMQITENYETDKVRFGI